MSKKLYAVVLDKKEISADLTLNGFALAVCENKRDAKNKLEYIYNIAKRKLLSIGVNIAKNRYSIEEYVLNETKQDAKWQKLKECISQEIQQQLDIDNELVQHAIEVEQWVLDKMNELESVDESK